MAYTQTNFLARIRDVMDATSSSRWSDPVLLDWADVVFDAEWTGLLDVAPTLRAATRTVTTDANGQVAWSSLNSGSGDTAQAFYKVLSVDDGNRLYVPIGYDDAPLATRSNSVYSQFDTRYYPFGEAFQFLPIASGQTLYVTVNHTPTRPGSLAGGSSTVTFPDPYGPLLAWGTAAMALQKGGAEGDTSIFLQAQADKMRQQMYADYARKVAVPQAMRFPDRAWEWGSR